MTIPKVHQDDAGSANERIPDQGSRNNSVAGLASRDVPLPAPIVALLTAGRDKHYAVPLALSLAENIWLDFIGSEDLAVPELRKNQRIRILNFRDRRPNLNPLRKALSVIASYWQIIRYTASAQPRIFHILWNNKFELFDRTLLMLYFKLMHKRVVLTAHNVNAGERDLSDSWLNRLSLKSQYQLSSHVFVHTERMKNQILCEFSIPEANVSVIPYGINNMIPDTGLSRLQARRQAGVSSENKVLLFFGNIAPYKGLGYLIAAFRELSGEDREYRLIIAGQPKWSDGDCDQIQQAIARSGVQDRIVGRIEFIPDEQTEWYFKAADVLVLPYTHIFQSGVLFLSYSFGLPAIVTDVGSLKDDIIDGQTGFVCAPRNSESLAEAIRRYFASELFRDLERRRVQIKKYANERYSWSKVAAITTGVYSKLLSS